MARILLGYTSLIYAVSRTLLRGLPAVILLWLAVTPVIAQAIAPIRGLNNPNRIPGQYVVVLKSNVALTKSAGVNAEAIASKKGFKVTHRFQSALNGFTIGATSVIMQSNSTSVLDALRNNPDVDFIEADQIVHLQQSQASDIFFNTVQSLLPGNLWGLDRINQPRLPLDNSYSFNTSGKNVHAYLIDSGINLDHREFMSRIAIGTNFVKDNGGLRDCEGHGTHVAGILGGATFGVAKNVLLHPVRVFGCVEGAQYSAIIAAVEWVMTNRQMPALINMSLGGSRFDALNIAVENAVAAGIPVVVSAGNEAGDACNASPAATPAAIAVGASDVTDTRSYFSNMGKCVGIFAPGSDITSAGIANPTAEKILSGTSMATAYVAGVVARYLEKNPTAKPADIKAALLNGATKDVLADIGVDSPNRLLNSQIDVDTTNASTWKRTIVFIYGQTEPGQDMFIRGGIDHAYAQNNLATTCTKDNMLCAIPMRHLNLRNSTTEPWKRGDLYLDWYGVELNQDTRSQGSALDWTTNFWPPEWGQSHAVKDDGYGETPFNKWGHHYWMVDIEMDCSKTVNGWFELKSFISNGPGWEADISQANAPYVSRNHFAQCGKLNVFRGGQHDPVTITDF